MTFKGFFTSDPGKATFALVVTAIFAVWPVAAGWVAASYTLTYAVDRLRRSFARLEAQEAAERLRQLEADAQAALTLRRLEEQAMPPLRNHATKIDTTERVAMNHDSRQPAGR